MCVGTTTVILQNFYFSWKFLNFYQFLKIQWIKMPLTQHQLQYLLSWKRIMVEFGMKVNFKLANHIDGGSRNTLFERFNIKFDIKDTQRITGRNVVNWLRQNPSYDDRLVCDCDGDCVFPEAEKEGRDELFVEQGHITSQCVEKYFVELSSKKTYFLFNFCFILFQYRFITIITDISTRIMVWVTLRIIMTWVTWVTARVRKEYMRILWCFNCFFCSKLWAAVWRVQRWV